MQSELHAVHIKTRLSHSDCSECCADRERRFVDTQAWPGYRHVSDYLKYVRPRLAACLTDDSTDARIWHRDFVKAMHRRISLRQPSRGRKYSDGYLERLGQFINRQYPYTGKPRFMADAAYLRQFARTGASAL